MYITNGSVGHWVDAFMADAAKSAPIHTAPLPLPPASDGGGEARLISRDFGLEGLGIHFAVPYYRWTHPKKFLFQPARPTESMRKSLMKNTVIFSERGMAANTPCLI